MGIACALCIKQVTVQSKVNPCNIYPSVSTHCNQELKWDLLYSALKL